MLPFMAYASCCRVESPVRVQRARVLRARPLHRDRRPTRAPSSRRIRALRSLEVILGRGRDRRRSRGGSRRCPLRPLREDLLRDADARVRHGLYTFPPQVLPGHGRRRRHARAPPSLLGRGSTRCRRRTTWSDPTTTTRWPCSCSPWPSCGASCTRRSGSSCARSGDNPVKAESLGLGVARYRWYAFVLSGVYGAVGGALLGPPTGNVDPTLAYWTQSGNIVFMTLPRRISRSFFGPAVGRLRLHLPAGHGDVRRALLDASSSARPSPSW